MSNIGPSKNFMHFASYKCASFKMLMEVVVVLFGGELGYDLNYIRVLVDYYIKHTQQPSLDRVRSSNAYMCFIGGDGDKDDFFP